MAGQIGASVKAEIAAPARAAIAAAPNRQKPPAPVAGPSKNFEQLASAAKTMAEVDALIKEAKAEGAPGSYLATLTTIGAAKAKDDGGLMERLGNPGDYGPTSEAEAQEAEAAIFAHALAEELAEEPIDAEIVEDEDPSDIYFLIVKAAGKHGWTTSRIDQEFAQRNHGTMPGSAEASELRAFLDHVKKL
jgi:hypothetical protein